MNALASGVSMVAKGHSDTKPSIYCVQPVTREIVESSSARITCLLPEIEVESVPLRSNNQSSPAEHPCSSTDHT